MEIESFHLLSMLNVVWIHSPTESSARMNSPSIIAITSPFFTINKTFLFEPCLLLSLSSSSFCPPVCPIQTSHHDDRDHRGFMWSRGHTPTMIIFFFLLIIDWANCCSWGFHDVDTFSLLFKLKKRADREMNRISRRIVFFITESQLMTIHLNSDVNVWISSGFYWNSIDWNHRIEDQDPIRSEDQKEPISIWENWMKEHLDSFRETLTKPFPGITCAITFDFTSFVSLFWIIVSDWIDRPSLKSINSQILPTA